MADSEDDVEVVFVKSTIIEDQEIPVTGLKRRLPDVMPVPATMSEKKRRQRDEGKSSKEDAAPRKCYKGREHLRNQRVVIARNEETVPLVPNGDLKTSEVNSDQLAVANMEETAPLVQNGDLKTSEADYDKYSWEMILTIEADLQAKVSDLDRDLKRQEVEIDKLKFCLRILKARIGVFEKNLDIKEKELKSSQGNAERLHATLNGIESDILSRIETLRLVRTDEIKTTIDGCKRALGVVGQQLTANMNIHAISSNKRALELISQRLLANMNLLNSLSHVDLAELLDGVKDSKKLEQNCLLLPVDSLLSAKRRAVVETVDALEEAQVRRVKVKDDLMNTHKLVNQIKIKRYKEEAAIQGISARTQSMADQIESTIQQYKAKWFELIELKEKLRTVSFVRQGKELDSQRQQWRSLASGNLSISLD